MALTRRDFLTTLGTACAIRSVERLLAAQNLAAPPDGRLIGTAALGRFDGRPAPPMGALLGAGLDARLWSHTWRPSRPGRYQIALGVGDRNVPARRLDLFYYTREVQIDQV